MRCSGALELVVPADGVFLRALLNRPTASTGLILLAHGSGSSRFSRPCRQLAQAFNGAGFATLSFDLLTVGETMRDAVTAEHRCDMALLGRRLVGVIDWVRREPVTARLPVGLFGSSTVAAAALVAAAERPRHVRVVVCRSGRVDLAEGALDGVEAPVLMIVGDLDRETCRLNRDAASRLHSGCEIRLIPGAFGLVEEPGKLDVVELEAVGWFRRHLRVPGQSSPVNGQPAGSPPAGNTASRRGYSP